MVKRTAIEKNLLEKAARYLPAGTVGNIKVPDGLSFLVRKGQGSRLWDGSGNEYIDWLMGSGPMVLGHAYPAVVDAVIEAVTLGSTFFTTHENAVLLAEELVRAVPCAQKVRFTTSGTDACFQGMRAARAFRQRDKVLKFEGAFHGTSDYALMSVSPSAALEFPQAEASSGGIPKVIEDLILSAPFNDLDTTSAIIEAHHTELAAVIVEPLQRIIAPRPGFLEGLREITARYGIILIFDEVVTGFRLAYGGAQEYYGVTPDLCAVGKIVGGGYPLGAIMGREDVMQVFNQDEILEGRHVPQIGTMNGSPVACAAGLATLTELRKEGTYPRLRDVGRRVRQGLADICAANGIMAQHCGEDVVFDVCFTDQPVMNYRDSLAADSRKMARFNFGLLEHGILKGQQKFYPSLAHTDEDINKTLEVFSAIIPQLRSL